MSGWLRAAGGRRTSGWRAPRPGSTRVLRGLGAGALLGGGALAAGELVHWWASRAGLGPRGGEPYGGGETVVVLGHADAGTRAGRENRARVRAGLRSLSAADSVLVLAGGAVAGPIPEARLMGRYAREIGYRGPLLLETSSRSTWENIAGVIPLIEGAQRIRIVSNCLHALKARHYLAIQRPDLAERLVRAEDYRLGERLLGKPASALYGLADLALTRLVPGWALWAAPGPAGLRRLVANRDAIVRQWRGRARRGLRRRGPPPLAGQGRMPRDPRLLGPLGERSVL